jgi:hypothetical protein
MLEIGHKYTKKDLYKLLNVPTQKQKGSWNTGYVKYNNGIYIFINVGIPGRTGHDYANKWEGSHLIWYAKTGSQINQPLIQEMIQNTGNVFIFSRTEERAPFEYVGMAKCINYEDSSPVMITWEIILQLPSIINPDHAWKIFVYNTNEAKENNEPFYSPIRHYKYSILDVSDKEVTLERVTTTAKRKKELKNRNPPKLTYNNFVKLINKFNSADRKLSKTELKNTVLYETVIVWFLPMLDWDETISHIIYSPSIPNTIAEAKDDQLIQSVTIQRRLRQGQNKLRNNLMYIYNNQCCITGCNVIEVLDACHIEPHSKNGYNHSTNALLLRSDIHDLWDLNLIGINPETLTVHIKPQLRDTCYDCLKYKQIAPRIDKLPSNKKALEDRWEAFNKL